MKKALTWLLVLYLLASLLFSVAHANSVNPWDFRQHRNGLLCIEYIEYSQTEREFVIYSPFCNWADVFLFGIAWEDVEGWTECYTFSDGFDCFGEWWI